MRSDDSAFRKPKAIRHIAWDIGIAGVCRHLADVLDATLVQQNYSRLVIDCNRTPGSENFDLRNQRTHAGAGKHAPETKVRSPLACGRSSGPTTIGSKPNSTGDAKPATPAALIAMHSFTPVFMSVTRPRHASVLYNRDPRFAHLLMAILQREGGLIVGDNEPYSVTDASDYTIPVHGERRGLHHVAIEIRQDLIADDNGQRAWGVLLARLLAQAYQGLMVT